MFFLTLLVNSLLFSQNLKITGIVFNEESHEPIPFTSIRIAGTTQGTSTNIEGKFLL
ncbi:MAG: carboxypeptidase-like regulatory domain-containing protein, partial [Melioribacteraceae bacterium]